jgi:biopolymer transport protein ExbB
MLAEFNWSAAIGSSPIFMVLIGCSIVALGVALERAYYFWKREGKPDNALAKCLKNIRAGDYRAAEAACESITHPMGAVAAEIFKKVAGQLESIEERMQIALSQQKMLLERNISVLGTLAAISPLIGLLGTVWGIMRAFQDMALTGSAAPTVVAAGVAEALITTAAGLVVAVPSLILYNHFTRRLNVMLTVAENHARTIRSAMLNAQTGMHHSPASDDDRHQTGQERKSPTGQVKEIEVNPEPALTR